MLKVAVLDDYQNTFQQIVKVDNYKDKFNFKVCDLIIDLSETYQITVRKKKAA